MLYGTALLGTIVERRLIISNFAAPLMRPGLVLPVYVNPRDPDDILIVW